jgi:hypothetical protein
MPGSQRQIDQAKAVAGTCAVQLQRLQLRCPGQPGQCSSVNGELVINRSQMARAKCPASFRRQNVLQLEAILKREQQRRAPR